MGFYDFPGRKSLVLAIGSDCSPKAGSFLGYPAWHPPFDPSLTAKQIGHRRNTFVTAPASSPAAILVNICPALEEILALLCQHSAEVCRPAVEAMPLAFS